MDQEQFNALASQHGGVIGSIALDPTVKGPVPGAPEEPNPHPTYRYVFADGTYMTMRSWDVVDPGTALKQTKASETSAWSLQKGQDGQLFRVNELTGEALPVEGMAGKNKPGDNTFAHGNTLYRWGKDENGNDVPLPIYTFSSSGSGGGGIEAQRFAAQQERDKLWQQVSRGEITPDQAISNFSEWYQMNVQTPMQLAKFGYDVGQDAVKNQMDLMPYKVGPKFGENFAAGLKTLSSGGGTVNFSPEDFTFQMPDLNQIAEQATTRALAGISPLAASRLGLQVPDYSKVDVSQIPAYAGPQ